MYAVAGVTGRVGSAVAHALREAGAPVRAVVRTDPGAGTGPGSPGRQVRIADLHDRAALTAALKGCTGCFLLQPFDLTAPDLEASARSLTASIVGAVRDAAPAHVVVLSSGGADQPSGTGPIAGLYGLEQALRSAGPVVTALRSGHFQEKVADLPPVAREAGVYPVFAASDGRPARQPWRTPSAVWSGPRPDLDDLTDCSVPATFRRGYPRTADPIPGVTADE